MSLLRQIQDAAVNTSVDLPSLLRMCKVLAARLGNSDFKIWIDRELSGYDSKEDLPEYRILKVNSKGHFGGPFGSGLRNADIPLSCVPKELRESLGHCYVFQPVAALSALVEKNTTGTLQEPWNPDIVAHVGRDIYESMVCMQAWKVVSASAFVAALDTIRTRVLNFVLEIEATNPAAGEALASERPIPEDKVQQIFHTYITGNVQNLASGSTNVSQSASWQSGSTAEMLEALLEAIKRAPLVEPVRMEATQSVEQLRDSADRPTMIERYHRFMGILANHMQVLGPVVAPFLPGLAAMVA